ncbi:MAG: PAS domain S-box protein [Candidatus Hydrogenedentes bacterium]|nr:PAS domain S-box protein [Candidatus Hydrogenedentota bacterium]
MTTPSQDDPIEPQSYANALQDLSVRYERLLGDISILREIDELDDPELEVPDICTRLVEAIASALAVENCSLALLDQNAEFLEIRAASSPFERNARYFGAGEWQGMKFRVSEGVIGKVVQTGQPIRVDDIHQHSDFVHLRGSSVEIRSLLCFPVLGSDKVIGALNLSHASPGFFTLERERTLELVAKRAGRLLVGHVLRQQLREAEQYHRLVMANAADAILVFDVAGKVVSANQAIETITGFPPDTYLRGKTLWLDRVYADDRAQFLRHREEVQASRMTKTLEYRVAASDGTTRYVEERSSAMRDSKGGIVGIISIIRDETERRNSEDLLARQQMRLYSSAKMASLGVMASGIAHEINNPLGIIAGAAEQLERMKGNSEVDLEHIAELSGKITRHVDRIAQIVRAMRNLAREGPQEPLALVPVKQIVDDSIALCRERFKRNDVRLSVMAVPASLTIEVRENQICQVLINLLNNAYDAVDGLADKWVTLEVADEGDSVQFLVTDAGLCPSPDIRDRVFDPFFTTKALGAGIGLGLSISKRIVDAYHGAISMENRCSNTCFVLVLPKKQGETEQ